MELNDGPEVNILVELGFAGSFPFVEVGSALLLRVGWIGLRFAGVTNSREVKIPLEYLNIKCIYTHCIECEKAGFLNPEIYDSG